MGTKEAEGFEEDLDSTEYHDGYGSSSLKECIELLNTAIARLWGRS